MWVVNLFTGETTLPTNVEGLEFGLEDVNVKQKQDIVLQGLGEYL
jgi:hypothetical protein